MALASDAMYSPRINATSYVSSSVYYGYVPPCKKENEQHSRVVECNDVVDLPKQCYNGSTMMETDEVVECGYRLDNNYRVISPDTPSTSRQYQTNYYNGEYQQQQQQQMQQQQCISRENIDRMQRTNRKRCSEDFAAAASQHKKFREEAVVTAAFTVVQEMQKTMDWPRCVMNQHHYT